MSFVHIQVDFRFQITFYVVIDMDIATIVRKSDSLIFSRVRVGERMALEVP